jgi:hypothetical protein
MRTKHGMRNFSFVLLLAPVLAGCDTNGGLTVGSTASAVTLTLPNCADGQLLGTDATGALTCVNAPTASLTTPGCQSGYAYDSDGKSLSCQILGTGTTDPTLETTITNTTTAVNNLQTQVTNLSNGGGGLATYVGVTTATTVGKVQMTGFDTGLNSANAMCAAQYAGSHFCSMPELYATVVAGKLDMTKTIPKSWIFMPSWHAPAATGGIPGTEDTPYGGDADNCGSMTYPTADRKWTGIQVEWTALSTGSSGFRFWGGAQATCHSTAPLACCK